ncbi:MAG: YqgE/AlgH family protein [Ferrovibrio sp.]|uniref:YqgE/AlgH family protein n=1 Tax=Ferrovibrio sp. TaxID=1917215 RepID=UPI00260384E9|nr:YqgE/AlgH family protein [Ferrovibrio sp.]MCW0236369.1 YqgE/AlgH family protein [Ferrovibrio sp.]
MTDTSDKAISGYLERQLLIAMPSMGDPRFSRTVIYMCSHNAEGAMGLVINKPYPGLTFPNLLTQLGIESTAENDIIVRLGGPVETGRGFVLHSTDYMRQGSVKIDESIGIGLTATLDVLRAIATGTGPQHSLFALGYAGWGAGQLDIEIQENAWLAVPADFELVFKSDLDSLWDRAVRKIGIDVAKLSSVSGHA